MQLESSDSIASYRGPRWKLSTVQRPSKTMTAGQWTLAQFAERSDGEMWKSVSHPTLRHSPCETRGLRGRGWRGARPHRTTRSRFRRPSHPLRRPGLHKHHNRETTLGSAPFPLPLSRFPCRHPAAVRARPPFPFLITPPRPFHAPQSHPVTDNSPERPLQFA